MNVNNVVKLCILKYISLLILLILICVESKDDFMMRPPPSTRTPSSIQMYRRENTKHQKKLSTRSTIKYYNNNIDNNNNGDGNGEDKDYVLLYTSKLLNVMDTSNIDIDIEINPNEQDQQKPTTNERPLHKINLRGGTSKSFEYFIPVWVGDNSLKEQQMFMVQVDTGSTALAIPGENCYFYDHTRRTDCTCNQGALDDPYQQGLSSEIIPCSSSRCKRGCGFKTPYTSYPNNCGFKISYQDGSFIGGDLVTDYVTVAGLTVHALFGNMQAQSLNFSQSTCPMDPEMSPRKRDGIMGLSYQSLDLNNGDDIFSLLVNTHQIHNSFSMCLSEEGGMLVFGGVDPKLNTTVMNYTPIVNEKYYSINCTGITVDGKELPSNGFNSISIVDSGTTIMFLRSDIFNDLIYFLLQHYNNLPGITSKSESLWNHQCYKLSDRQLERYPTISLVLQDVNGGEFELAIPPNLYMIKIEDMYCFGFERLPLRSPYSVLIGDVALQGYNVHYNREDKSIGFAPVSSDCGKGQDSNQYHIEMIPDDDNKDDQSPGSLVVKIHAIDSNGRDGGAPNVNVFFDVVKGDCIFKENQLPSISKSSDKYGYAKTSLQCNQDQYAVVTVGAFENDRIISNKLHFNLQVTGDNTNTNSPSYGGNDKHTSNNYEGLRFYSYCSFIIILGMSILYALSYYLKRDRNNMPRYHTKTGRINDGDDDEDFQQKVDMINLLNTNYIQESNDGDDEP